MLAERRKPSGFAEVAIHRRACPSPLKLTGRQLNSNSVGAGHAIAKTVSRPLAGWSFRLVFYIAVLPHCNCNCCAPHPRVYLLKVSHQLVFAWNLVENKSIRLSIIDNRQEILGR